MEADAINTLKGSLYYQGNQMVDNYLDSFLTLASDARYTDPWTLVVKFCQDLKLNIQSQIATMPFRQPADTDLEAWYAVVQRMNQAWLANKTFQSILRSTTSAPSRSALPWSTPLAIFRPPQPAPPPVSPRSPLPIPSGGIPMDVDAVQKMCSLPLRGCYQCGEANYLMRDCSYYLDIQRLTAEQREELIEDLMVLKDCYMMENTN